MSIRNGDSVILGKRNQVNKREKMKKNRWILFPCWNSCVFMSFGMKSKSLRSFFFFFRKIGNCWNIVAIFDSHFIVCFSTFSLNFIAYNVAIIIRLRSSNSWFLSKKSFGFYFIQIRAMKCPAHIQNNCIRWWGRIKSLTVTRVPRTGRLVEQIHRY